MDLFRRKIELNAGGKLLKQPLTIDFDVPFDDSEKINTAIIEVYNLSESTIAGIITNSVVSLYAGYEGDMGLVFQGLAKNVQTTWSGVDKITKIQCTEEHKNYLTQKVVKTFAPGTTSTTILKYLIGEADLGIGDFSPVVEFTYRSGKTLKGTVDKLIKSIVKDTKSKMHILRGKIYIRDRAKGDPTGFIVNKESGLIAHPEKIESEEGLDGSKEKVVRNGFKVVTLLNHRVTVDSYLVLQSKTANGQHRVSRGRHYSDGRSFYTESEVY